MPAVRPNCEARPFLTHYPSPPLSRPCSSAGRSIPLMGDTLPLVTLFGAVAAAVWVGGYRPAVDRDDPRLPGVCVPVHSTSRQSSSYDVANVVGLVAYLFTCALIIGFGEAMRRAQRSGRRPARIVAGDAAQHWRRRHHHRQPRPHHVSQCRCRVVDRLDAGKPSGNRSIRCFESSTSRHAGRWKVLQQRPFEKALSSAWRTTRC